MVNNHKVRESGSHFAVTALTSAGIFAIIAILVVMLVAAAVIKAFMPVPSIGYAINAALLVASFAGTFYGCKKIGGKYAVTTICKIQKIHKGRKVYPMADIQTRNVVG